ncbi:putative DNA-binding protein [Virgibacillus sp. NKC19-16]|uniref:putative DNA-binding protein n=1 Tax=Virgibacillus salidurans TaxID=2831673 RepID=UPI001F2D8080|nr:putative DNA-binding protein [Virgibacillus sp. NKC19-16]UJL47912.1 putative DNA-binding protein [Virgibacillus sp. NKC19-16]
MLEKTTRINYLFDFYQSLLTPKQRDYMEMYFVEDYSLGEISDLSLVSRQAVYDNIRRTEKMLESYEEKLHLYEKFIQRATLIEKMEQSVPENENNLLNMINQLKELD